MPHRAQVFFVGRCVWFNFYLSQFFAKTILRFQITIQIALQTTLRRDYMEIKRIKELTKEEEKRLV